AAPHHLPGSSGATGSVHPLSPQGGERVRVRGLSPSGQGYRGETAPHPNLLPVTDGEKERTAAAAAPRSRSTGSEAETAIGWPSNSGGQLLPDEQNAPSLSTVVTTLASLGKAQLPAQLARWLDALDETGRWALLKLVTGALRIGVSA